MTDSDRIVAIETICPRAIMPNLLLLRIHTDSGLVGHGESYYIPEAVAAVLHDWFAERLLGADALAIESHWRFLYERALNFGGRGAELRALSALDCALWDILGQRCGQPVWRLLGGPVREHMPVYNSSGGRSYGASDTASHGWPGYGDPGRPGELEDNWAARHEPEAYARELVAAGYPAVKVWGLDALAHEAGGPLRLDRRALRSALEPLHRMRDAVGDALDICFDGHGFFQWQAAMQIAEELRPIRPLWVEDVLRPDSIDTLARFRRESGLTVASSEMFTCRADYTAALCAGAADVLMIDPTWVGGISETKRLSDLALSWNIPVTMHDCTGPLTLMAGLQVGFACSNVMLQETVRAHIAHVYPQLLEANLAVEEGAIARPTAPGLGLRLRPDLFADQRHQHRISSLGSPACTS